MPDLCRICSIGVVPASGIMLDSYSSAANEIKGNVCHVPDTCSRCDKTLNILRQAERTERDRIMRILRQDNA